jgi:hypothetical protein
MILKSKHITLKPVKNLDYTISLLSKYNERTLGEVKEFVDKNGIEFWVVMYKNQRVGTIGYYKIDDDYILESVKDRDAIKVGLLASKEAGDLVTSWMSRFTDKVKTGVKKSEPAIQRLVNRLGFKQIDTNVDYIIYEKEMKRWVG